ncbi:uncharacterized protein FA14DRAFT_161689 [Meira miltonrushii]|uniref:Sterol regulatory element-binding protein cleavage-activating protein n=1 Tax=Meira miltonrushii TaxID=1280837 RepID=A0A316V9S4_9BASI|nr:uncharacterized protein FA14DRAFT_161689 [Meira miltonrushii]PWN34220.1 hypothetical protein FA14DRAFT_161689 [Meira miltonrushii]
MNGTESTYSENRGSPNRRYASIDYQRGDESNISNRNGTSSSTIRPPLKTRMSNDKAVNDRIQAPNGSTPALQNRLYRSGSATLAPPSNDFRANSVVSSSPSKGRAKRNKRISEKETESIQSQLARNFERLSLQSRSALEKQYRKHGRRIARHPVQTLVLTCLIVTSLFYPAVGIYLWSSKGGPGVTRGDAGSVWRSLSTPLLDSFASSGRKHHNSIRDLRMIWDDAPDLRAIDARDSDAYSIGSSVSHWHSSLQHGTHEEIKSNTCTSVRVEHVFITTEDVIMGLGHRYGSLHTPILRSALNLQRSIETFLESGEGRSAGLPNCIRDLSTDKCLVLSPLSYWSMDKDLIATDSAPTTTILRSTLNYTEQGVPITLSTSLAGRSHLFQQLPRADHLALTFFLEDEEGCNTSYSESSSNDANPAHLAWSSMLRNITGRQVSLLNSDWHVPKEIVLQFIPRHPEESFPTQKVLLAVGYIAMIVWLTRSLFRIRNVHSPLGLAFTACVELVISMTLAISVCALSGIRLTLVPWEILPFVIVVIGSENMFALTNAIVSTSTSLSVGARLAAGFEKAGVPIAVTVLSDVLLMATISFVVNVRAVREFCIFAIFALIVDFFMQFYLYATVLSIDMQRLELADLLSQDNREVQNGNHTLNDDTESIHSESASVDDAMTDSLLPSRGASLIKQSCRAAWRARTARTFSLSLLLAFMAGIYLYHGSGYTSSFSYPFSVQENERAAWNHVSSDLTPPLPSAVTNGEHAFDPFSHLQTGEDGAIDLNNPPSPWWHSSPSARLWQTLNPNDAASVHVKVEPWTVVSLPSASRQHVKRRNFASWAIFRPRVRAFIWFFKLVILPIAGTTALLWVLLLYLLKDTELLDAKRSKFEEQDESDEERIQLQRERVESSSHLDTTLAVCAEGHGFDITLVCYAGVHVISVAADSTLQIARASRKGTKLENLVILKDVLQSYHPVSALAADLASDMIMIGHANGHISLFSISSLRLIRTSLTDQFTEEARPSSRISNMRLLPIQQPSSPLEPVSILSFHRDGSAWRWTSDGPPTKAISLNPTQTAWAAIEVSKGALSAKDVILFSSSDGSFSVYKLMEEAPYAKTIMSARSTAGIVKCATLLNVPTDSSRASKAYVAVGTVLGKLVLYEADTSRHVAQIDLCGSPIDRVRSLHGDSTKLSESAHDGFDGILLAAVTSSSATLLSLEGILSTPSVSGSHIVPPTVSKWNQSSDQGSTDASHGPPGSPNGSPRALRRSSHSRPPAPDMNAHERSPSVRESNESIHSSDPSGSTTLSGTNTFGFNIFAEFDCRRGGADVVLTATGASLVGVRRLAFEYAGMRDAEGNGANRWEMFEVNLYALWNSKYANSHNVLYESDCEHLVRKAPLLIEEEASLARMNDSYDSGAITTARERGQNSNMLRGSRAVPTTLSFTRLGHVSAYYKNDRSPAASSTRLPVLFTFGNALGIAYATPDKSVPKKVEPKVSYQTIRKGQ